MKLEINEKLIETDKEGFLSDPYQWEPAVAMTMADIDGIELNDGHWKIIKFLRNYYDVYSIAPDLRTLTKAIERSNSPEINKAYLTALFPQSPAIMACRYAGLPKPISGACV